MTTKPRINNPKPSIAPRSFSPYGAPAPATLGQMYNPNPISIIKTPNESKIVLRLIFHIGKSSS